MNDEYFIRLLALSLYSQKQLLQLSMICTWHSSVAVFFFIFDGWWNFYICMRRCLGRERRPWNSHCFFLSSRNGFTSHRSNGKRNLSSLYQTNSTQSLQVCQNCLYYCMTNSYNLHTIGGGGIRSFKQNKKKTNKNASNHDSFSLMDPNNTISDTIFW